MISFHLVGLGPQSYTTQRDRPIRAGEHSMVLNRLISNFEQGSLARRPGNA